MVSIIYVFFTLICHAENCKQRQVEKKCMCKKCIYRLGFMPMHCMHRSAADPETFKGAGPWVVWGDKQKGVGELEHFGNISCLFTI